MPLVGTSIRPANNTYFMKSAYGEGHCWHQDGAQIGIWSCNAFGDADKFDILCNNLGCEITQDNTGDLVISNNSLVAALVPGAPTSIVIHGKQTIPPNWVGIDSHIWSIVESNACGGCWKIKDSDEIQCAEVLDTSIAPPDSTSIGMRPCIDNSDVNPQDLILIPAQ